VMQCTSMMLVKTTALACIRSVVDLAGVRGVQVHSPLAASNVFLRT